MNPYLIAGIIAITSAATWQVCEWKHDSEKVAEVVERIEVKQKQIEASDSVVEETIKNVNKTAPILREIHEKIIRIKTSYCELDPVTTGLLIRATSSRLSKSARVPKAGATGHHAITCKAFAAWAVKQIEKYRLAQELNSGLIRFDKKMFGIKK